jgi:hypothetical protein
LSYQQPDALFRDALAGTLTLPGGGSFTFTAGTNLVSGPLRASNEGTTTDPAASVEFAGGPPPIPYFGGAGTNGGDLYEARLQVTVRSAPDSYDQGAQIGLAIRTKMHKATIAGLLSCLAQDSAPQFIGQDDTKRFRWLLNFSVRWEQ